MPGPIPFGPWLATCVLYLLSCCLSTSLGFHYGPLGFCQAFIGIGSGSFGFTGASPLTMCGTCTGTCTCTCTCVVLSPLQSRHCAYVLLTMHNKQASKALVCASTQANTNTCIHLCFDICFCLSISSSSFCLCMNLQVVLRTCKPLVCAIHS